MKFTEFNLNDQLLEAISYMGFDEETDFLHYVNGVRRHFSGVVVAGQDLDQF